MPARNYPRVIWLRTIKPASMTKTTTGTLYTFSSEFPLLVTRETENDWIGTKVEECLHPSDYLPRHLPLLSYWSKKIWKDSQQEEDDAKELFMQKIADGKLLMLYSHMTGNVTCDCCHSEEKIVYHPDFPDTMQHKPWCIVTAARTFFPGFEPTPHNKPRRSFGRESLPEFDWFASEMKEEVSSNAS